MPIKYKIFPDKKFVYALGIGEITYDDLFHHIDKLATDPDYTPPMKKLVDYRNSTLSRLSTEESIRISDRKAQLIKAFKDEKCAFVIKSNLDFGMTRFHGLHIEESGITTNVFRNMEDALEWLEVDLDENEIITG